LLGWQKQHAKHIFASTAFFIAKLFGRCTLLIMSSVTRLIAEMEQGSDQASSELFRLVYDELRLLARQLMANERVDHTLGATALVHEVYLRLTGGRDSKSWKNRAYFFSAAAEAMRRILIDHARRKRAQRHGGRHVRIDLGDVELAEIRTPEAGTTDLLALDEAISRLAADYPAKAELVKLLYFAGLSLEEVAAILGTSRTNVYRQWQFARAWLRRFMSESEGTAIKPRGKCMESQPADRLE
jgi:RNA polymerase sigma factor (TIGR02999 family)